MLGILLGLVAVFGGSVLEGGSIDSIVQGSAALIVFGGTLGATFLSFSTRDIKLALHMAKEVFIEKRLLPENNVIVRDIVNMAGKARRDGILSLDNAPGRYVKDSSAAVLGFIINKSDCRIGQGRTDNGRE